MTGEQLLGSVLSIIKDAAEDGLDMFITPDMYTAQEAAFLSQELMKKGFRVETKALKGYNVLIIDWSDTHIDLDNSV